MNFTKTSETKACTSPGNIRESQNVIERSLIVCETENFSVDESRLSQQSVKKGAGSRLYLPQKMCFLVSSLGQTSFFSFRRLNWVPKDFGAIERLRCLYFWITAAQKRQEGGQICVFVDIPRTRNNRPRPSGRAATRPASAEECRSLRALTSPSSGECSLSDDPAARVR
jgi:hypothetical protein